MSASSIAVTVHPWVVPYVALMLRCGVRGDARQAVVDFVCDNGMQVM